MFFRLGFLVNILILNPSKFNIINCFTHTCLTNTCSIYLSMALFAYTTLNDFKTVHSFCCHYFTDYPKYEKVLPTSNHPEPLYGAAKTHKFDPLYMTITKQLKLWQMIIQTGTYTYNAAQITAESLKSNFDEKLHIKRNMEDFLSLQKNHQKSKKNTWWSNFCSPVCS